MYQIYERDTGRILSSIAVSEEVAEYMREQGEALIEGEGGDQEHFVDINASPPKIKERPVQQIRQDKTHIKADGKDKVTFSGLPKPCKIWVNFEACECNDGVLELTSLLAGVHQIHVEAFPFQTWHGEVIADGI